MTLLTNNINQASQQQVPMNMPNLNQSQQGLIQDQLQPNSNNSETNFLNNSNSSIKYSGNNPVQTNQLINNQNIVNNQNHQQPINNNQQQHHHQQQHQHISSLTAALQSKSNLIPTNSFDDSDSNDSNNNMQLINELKQSQQSQQKYQQYQQPVQQYP